jgi:hypothetical protein
MQNFQFATHVLYSPSEMKQIKPKFFTDFLRIYKSRYLCKQKNGCFLFYISKVSRLLLNHDDNAVCHREIEEG